MEDLTGRHHIGDLGADGWIILEQVLESLE
jgi:hypothetical protein